MDYGPDVSFHVDAWILWYSVENAKRALKPTLIILVGFLSAVFACVAMGIVKFLMHRWNGGEAIATFDQSTIENVEDVSIALDASSWGRIFDYNHKMARWGCLVCCSIISFCSILDTLFILSRLLLRDRAWREMLLKVILWSRIKKSWSSTKLSKLSWSSKNNLIRAWL